MRPRSHVPSHPLGSSTCAPSAYDPIVNQPAPGAPLPPPTPQAAQRSSASRLPLVAACAALVVALVMAALWLGARSDSSDAIIERDAVTAERDAANAARIEAENELQAALDNSDRTTQSGAGETASDDIEVLREQTEELAAEIDRLEDERDELAAELEIAQAESPTPAPVESTTSDDTVVESSDEPDGATLPDDETNADTDGEDADSGDSVTVTSPEDIGDAISTLFRDPVLGPGQELCLGEYLIEELGEERTIGAIESESPGDDDEFVDTLDDATDACGIDPSAVFG